MPRIGVALGGGSARGLTHIPFIEAMDELGLKPSVIAGTSIGALIGAGWANGMTGKELREHSMSVLGTMRIIAARLWGAQIRNLGGLLQNGFNMQLDATRVVDAFLPEPFPDDFAELQGSALRRRNRFPVLAPGRVQPGAAAAGHRRLDRHPERCSSRCAIANHLLVDGGVVNPLPLDQASRLRHPRRHRRQRRPVRSAWAATDFRALDVWFGSAQIMMHSLTAHMMAAYPPDVYARPHVSSFGALEFWRVKEILAYADREKDHFKRNLSRKVEQFIMKSGEITRAGD